MYLDPAARDFFADWPRAVVGTLDLDFEAMEFPAHPGLTLSIYLAAAGTPAAAGLQLLASWAATTSRSEAAGA